MRNIRRKGFKRFVGSVEDSASPQLLARTIYPDSTGKMILPTEARTTDLYAADHEDVYRLFESGEPAVVGGRVVRNLVTASEDMTDASWVAVDATPTATTVEFTAQNGGMQFVLTSVVGHTYTVSFDVRRLSGNSAIHVQHVNSTTGLFSEITIADTAQRMSVTFGARSGGGTVYVGIQDRSASGFGTIEITNWQIEDVTGRGVTTPSEYVSSDVGLAVYSTENGNSVASNVVTEAVGSALSPAPYVLTTPGATNSCAYSQDLTGTGWTTFGTITTARDAVDCFGNSNSATTLNDTDATKPSSRYFTLTVSADTNTNVFRVKVKKTTGTSNFPSIEMYYGGAGRKGVCVDTDNGTLTNISSGAPAASSIREDGGFFTVTISLANTSQTSMVCVLRPAYNADGSATEDVSTTGLAVFDQAEIFLNTAHAVAHALPPIPTSGSAVTTDDTEVSIDWPTGLTNDFVIKGTIIYPEAFGSGISRIWELGDDRTFTLFSRPSGIIRQEDNGVDFSFTGVSGSITGGDTVVVRSLKSSFSGITMWADSTKGSTPLTGETADLGNNVGSNDMNLGSAYNGFNTAFMKLRDIQIWSVPANITDAAVLALTP